VESWPPYVEELKSLGASVFVLNIERDALPFEDESVDIVIANQILISSHHRFRWRSSECFPNLEFLTV
jgi:hypothetical protein